MRLIDADALEEILQTGLRDNPHQDGFARVCHRSEYTHFLDVIRRMPVITPPPNDPLILEELEGMVGEPLYVIPVEKDPDWNPCWVICEKDYILVNSIKNERRAYLLRRNQDYGKTWLAYRHKPEEG